MGTFDIAGISAAKKKDNHGREKDITKVTIRMHHAVRDDLLSYLQSNVKTEVEQEI